MNYCSSCVLVFQITVKVKLHLFKTLLLAHKVCPRDENKVLSTLILKVLVMHLQNLEVLILLA